MARARVEALRSRFVRAPEQDVDARRPSTVAAETKPRPVIGTSVVERFAPLAGGRVRPVVQEAAKRGVTKTANVELPARAGDEVAVEDDASHVAIRFAPMGAADVPLELAQGIALYRAAIAGADVVHRVHAEGKEDFVAFESKPAHEELAYRVDVTRVDGLRLVSNTVEFLDASGAPRLRIAPPYVVDAKGATHDAKLAIEGCAYDTDPSGPWGRGVTTVRRRGSRRSARHGLDSGASEDEAKAECR